MVIFLIAGLIMFYFGIRIFVGKKILIQGISVYGVSVSREVVGLILFVFGFAFALLFLIPVIQPYFPVQNGNY